MVKVGELPQNQLLLDTTIQHWYFLTEIIRVCDDKQNTTLMVIACTSKKFKLLNFTKQQGGVFKLIKTWTNMISQFNTLIAISLFNYLKQAFQP
jgi:hypothetical protein